MSGGAPAALRERERERERNSWGGLWGGCGCDDDDDGCTAWSVLSSLFSFVPENFCKTRVGQITPKISLSLFLSKQRKN